MEHDDTLVTVTGHRPNKLTLPGYSGYSEFVQKRLVNLAEAALRKIGPDKIFSGMALGWDMASAEAAYRTDTPFVAAIPFVGQESLWPEQSRLHYEWLLSKATEVVVVCEGRFAPWKMQKRNEFMVDKSNAILALWNGTSGGTGNCIEYARKQGRKIVNLWDSWVKYAVV